MNCARPKWDVEYEKMCIKEGKPYPGIHAVMEKWIEVLGEAIDDPKTRPLCKEAFLKLVRINLEGEIRDWQQNQDTT